MINKRAQKITVYKLVNVPNINIKFYTTVMLNKSNLFLRLVKNFSSPDFFLFVYKVNSIRLMSQVI